MALSLKRIQREIEEKEKGKVSFFSFFFLVSARVFGVTFVSFWVNSVKRCDQVEKHGGVHLICLRVFHIICVTIIFFLFFLPSISLFTRYFSLFRIKIYFQNILFFPEFLDKYTANLSFFFIKKNLDLSTYTLFLYRIIVFI